MKLKKFENLKKLQLKTNELSSVNGGTTTTLVTTVGYAENEYEDSNGNKEFDKDDEFNGTFDFHGGAPGQSGHPGATGAPGF